MFNMPHTEAFLLENPACTGGFTRAEDGTFQAVIFLEDGDIIDAKGPTLAAALEELEMIMGSAVEPD